ncbi:GerAB/ArcD/ProY family transporter [Dethiobacter alkaliphilus]|uniref:Spore germination protein n=1 Tax=Dethiobacter alkaliphilus AHT 1 TaxID=555088 RepID=C0GII9_DETAL|nr:endospore germination permease [Dethiobacter alkaliphilus]EEG76850.1 spore germination protein [Dethiobacter alkaliphilus AHT 1]
MSIKDSVTDRLDVRILLIVLIVSIIEFEIFVIPKATARVAGQDAWIAMLLGSVFIAFNTFILVKLTARFPRENFFEFGGKVWGKPLSYVIILGYLAYWFIFLSFLLKDFNVVNETFFVREAHPAVSVTLFTLGAVWVVIYGFPAVVRLLQMMAPFLLLPLIMVAALQVVNIRLENLQPVLGNGVLPVLKGAVLFAGFWQGLELLLFTSPFIKKPQQALKPALLAVGVLTALAVAQTISVIGVLGVDHIEVAIWPGINAMSAIAFPGFPVERFELFLTLPWIVAIFTTLCVFLYLLSFGIIQLLHIPYRKLTVFLCAGLIVASSLLFPNYPAKMQYFDAFALLTIVFVLLIPSLTLILAIIRKKEGHEIE